MHAASQDDCVSLAASAPCHDAILADLGVQRHGKGLYALSQGAVFAGWAASVGFR